MTWLAKSLTTSSGIGLGYDIVGVIILAWGIFAAGYRDLRNQVDSGYGGVSPGIYRSLFQQQRDVGFGLFLVVMGFAMQFIGVGYSSRLDRVCVIVAWLFLAIATIAYYCLRKRGVDRAGDRYLNDPRKDI